MAKKNSFLEKDKKEFHKNTTQIRNIASSAHIHHGKTALTDNLLAAAGMMSEKIAGDLKRNGYLATRGVNKKDK
jgi:elongation factor 2